MGVHVFKKMNSKTYLQLTIGLIMYVDHDNVIDIVFLIVPVVL